MIVFDVNTGSEDKSFCKIHGEKRISNRVYVVNYSLCH